AVPQTSSPQAGRLSSSQESVPLTAPTRASSDDSLVHRDGAAEMSGWPAEWDDSGLGQPRREADPITPTHAVDPLTTVAGSETSAYRASPYRNPYRNWNAYADAPAPETPPSFQRLHGEPRAVTEGSFATNVAAPPITGTTEPPAPPLRP
ncbi:unnamed protein product, partial [Amoebophrya sp. A120]